MLGGNGGTRGRGHPPSDMGDSKQVVHGLRASGPSSLAGCFQPAPAPCLPLLHNSLFVALQITALSQFWSRSPLHCPAPQPSAFVTSLFSRLSSSVRSEVKQQETCQVSGWERHLAVYEKYSITIWRKMLGCICQRSGWESSPSLQASWLVCGSNPCLSSLAPWQKLGKTWLGWFLVAWYSQIHSIRIPVLRRNEFWRAQKTDWFLYTCTERFDFLCGIYSRREEVIKLISALASRLSFLFSLPLPPLLFFLK